MKKILSIDGGGIRGVIPGMVMKYMEEQLQKKTGNSDARITDYFDFLAGTSTGGILTCALLVPSKEKSDRPKFSAAEAVELYLANGEKIFKTSWLRKREAKYGLVDELYAAKGIEEVLQHYFGDAKLSQLLKPCLIPAYETELRQTYFFGQHKAIADPYSRDYLVRDVCRATSAAPSYFETSHIHSLGAVAHTFIDGGIFANNPSLCAYAEVRRADDQPKAKDMFVLSLGTGSTKHSYDYEKIKDQPAMSLIPALVDMMMSGVSETTHFELVKMFEAVNCADQYIRIEPESLRNVNEEMDDASKSNLEDLQTLGDATAQAHRETLGKIVDMLIKSKEDKLVYTPKEPKQ
jgi:patatin-like phospholipase/acyl hydrolase